MQVFIKCFIGFIVLLTFGCSQGNPTAKMLSDVAKEMPKSATTSKPAAVGNATTEAEKDVKSSISDRKLIKKGNVEFETGDIHKTYDHILTVVEKYGGYIASEREHQSHYRTSNSISIRIPYQHFDIFLAEATDGVKHFDSKIITVSDVTEEFLDISARLKTKKEMEIRFLGLLKKANTIEEVLTVERHIGDLRSEIESIEGRLNYLKNQTSLSTLDMTFYKSIHHQPIKRSRFKDAFLSGWDNLISFLVGLTHIWPFILMLLAFLAALFFYQKKRKRKI